MKMALLFVPLLALGACSKPDSAPGPGGVTMGEARALDEAATMLDERRPPPAGLVPSPVAEPDGEPSSAAE